MPYNSPNTLFFWCPRSCWYSYRIIRNGIGKICIFPSVDESPGSDASLPKLCVHSPRWSSLTWTCWRTDTQRHQQPWSSTSLVCSTAGSHEGPLSLPSLNWTELAICSSEVVQFCSVAAMWMGFRANRQCYMYHVHVYVCDMELHCITHTSANISTNIKRCTGLLAIAGALVLIVFMLIFAWSADCGYCLVENIFDKSQTVA